MKPNSPESLAANIAAREQAKPEPEAEPTGWEQIQAKRHAEAIQEAKQRVALLATSVCRRAIGKRYSHKVGGTTYSGRIRECSLHSFNITASHVHPVYRVTLGLPTRRNKRGRYAKARTVTFTIQDLAVQE